MSSRRLRKIQQEKELEDAKRRAAEEEDDDDESADEPVSSNKAGAFSAFAALDEDEDEDVDTKEMSEDEPEIELEPVSAPAPKAKKTRKKKKKAKKSHAMQPENENESDEIEAALRELNIKKPTTVHAPLPSKTPLDLQWDRICNLLTVQAQHLKVGHEMRNLFGRAATDNHDDAGGRPGRQRQRQQVSN